MGPLLGSGASLWGYAAFVVLALLGPGVGLQRALRIRVDPALVLPLGYAWTAASYLLSIAAHAPVLFPVLVGVAVLPVLWAPTAWARAEGPSLRGALPPLIAMVALLGAAQYRFAVTEPDGAVLLDPVEAIDTCLHVGFAWELSQGYPIQVPGLAGQRLVYPQLGHDLVRAAAVRWARVHPYDLLQRYDVTLAALALLLALRALVHALGGSPWAVALVGWTPLLGDFSFLFGRLEGASWWIDLLSSNLLLHLAYANAVVMALALLSAALVAWRRSEGDSAISWRIVAAALAMSVPCFKLILAAPFAIGLWAAVPRRRRALWLGVPCVGAMLGLLLPHGPSTLVIRLDPLAQPLRTAQSLGWLPLAGVPLILFSCAWLIAALGVRWLGIPGALGAVLRGSGQAQVLAATALASGALGLTFRLTFAGEEADYNVGYYFLVQCGALLWVFTAMAIPRPARLAVRACLLAALAALTLPSSLQFAWKKAHATPLRVPAAVVHAAEALRRDSHPGDVVIEPPSAPFPPPGLVLGARRVAFTTFLPYMVEFASPAEIARRRDEVASFFETEDPSRAAAIARELGARYVLSFGPKRPRLEARGGVVPVFSERRVALYRLTEP